MVIDGVGYLLEASEDDIQQIREVVSSYNQYVVNVEVAIFPVQRISSKRALSLIRERKRNVRRNNKIWQHCLYDTK